MSPGVSMKTLKRLDHLGLQTAFPRRCGVQVEEPPSTTDLPTRRRRRPSVRASSIERRAWVGGCGVVDVLSTALHRAGEAGGGTHGGGAGCRPGVEISTRARRRHQDPRTLEGREANGKRLGVAVCQEAEAAAAPPRRAGRAGRKSRRVHTGFGKTPGG